MFGIGIPELVLIAIVALVVVGPKNLPTTLRAVGRAIREFQRASRELREQAGFDEVVDEVTRPLREGLSGIEKDVLADIPQPPSEVRVDTSLEYPESGPDDFGALPENSSYYPDGLPQEPASQLSSTLGGPQS
jgi:Tat protein translocase TatB subunit